MNEKDTLIDIQGLNIFNQQIKKEITQAEYDLLTDEEKHSGTIFFITDGVASVTDETIEAIQEKLNGIEENANNYEHPTYTPQSSGLYKITVDETGHISEVATATKTDITTALGYTPPTNGFKKYSTTFTYTERETAAPIGSCTIPYTTSDGFLIVASQYEQYLYLITCRSDITISAIKASGSTTPSGTRNGNNNTITISNIPYIGSMNGSLTVYSFS